MHFMKRIKGQAGFTLLESLFHLTAFVLFSGISVLVVMWAMDLQNIHQMKHDVNWELFVYDVQQYNQHAISGELESSGVLQLKPLNDPQNRTFFFEKPNEHIRKRSDKGGNEIMLPHVQSLYYLQRGHEVIMKVVTADGKARERMLVLPHPPK